MRWALLICCVSAGCRNYDAFREHGDLAGADFAGADFAGADLAGVDLGPDMAMYPGPTCNPPDLAGLTPTNPTYSGTTGLSATLGAQASSALSEIHMFRHNSSETGVFGFNPSSGEGLIYTATQASAWTAAKITPIVSSDPPASATATADLHGDGSMQVVLGGVGAVTIVTVVGGTNTSSSTKTTGTVTGLAFGHFTGAKDMDIVAFEKTNTELLVYETDSYTIESAPSITGTSWAVLDEDGDCNDDLVAIDSLTASAHVMRGGTMKGLTVESYSVLDNASLVARAQLLSPKADGLYAVFPSHLQLLVQGKPVADAPLNADLGITLLTTGDLNNDGMTDVIAWDTSHVPHAFLVERTGVDTYALAALTIPADLLQPGTSTPLVFDMDFDGYPDLVFGNTMTTLTPYWAHR